MDDKIKEGAEVIEAQEVVEVNSPKAIIAADLKDEQTISVKIYCLDGSKENTSDEITGKELQKLLDEATTKLIKMDIEPKDVQVLYGMSLTDLIINQSLNSFKDGITKKLVDMKKKNMELLSDESCVLDENTKNSVLKAVAVIDKSIDVIGK